MKQPELETLPSILNDPSLLLSQIRRFVAQCMVLLEEGGQPELMGLDDQVKILCEHVAKMDLKEAEILSPKMGSLIAELDQLAKMISKERALVMEQLNELHQQQKAFSAYSRASITRPTESSESAGE